MQKNEADFRMQLFSETVLLFLCNIDAVQLTYSIFIISLDIIM